MRTRAAECAGGRARDRGAELAMSQRGGGELGCESKAIEGVSKIPQK